MAYYFRKNKAILWFGVTCIALALNENTLVANDPSVLFHPISDIALSGNAYLATFSLSTMCMNICTGYSFKRSTSYFHHIYNALCLIFAAISVVISDSHMGIVYVILYIFAVCTYAYSIYSTIKYSKTDICAVYPAFAYSLMLAATFLGIIPILLHGDFISVRLICTPIYLILHIIMFTRQYRRSINTTKALSKSLLTTIENINHSDNALMCTQMKADFLYKTLELISVKCDEDPWTAEDLTISLSKYLRHTLNFQQLKGIVPLGNEIELTKAFIFIAKERKPFISFEYDFPNPLPDFHVPPLSIQPIVENAIDHAFIKKTEGAKIKITIVQYRDFYQIDISDNGDGMDENLAESLTDTLHDSARIGIYNIHTRLINLFGKGLVIQSAPGVGTSISFVVPPDASEYLDKVVQYNE